MRSLTTISRKYIASYGVWDKINPFRRYEKVKTETRDINQKMKDIMNNKYSRTDRTKLKDEKEAQKKDQIRKEMYPGGSTWPRNLPLMTLEGNQTKMEFSGETVVFVAYSVLAAEQAERWIEKFQSRPDVTIKFFIVYAYSPTFLISQFQTSILKQLRIEKTKKQVDGIFACFDTLPFKYERRYVAIFVVDRNAMIRYQTFGEFDLEDYLQLIKERGL